MHRLPLLLVSALVGAAFLPAGDASAQQKVYRWKDASGRIHYSGTPPRSGTYQVRSVAGRDLRVPAAASIAKEPAHCVAARRNLELLKGEGIVQIDSDGDGKPERALNPEERAAQTRLAESVLAADCNGPSAQATTPVR